MMFKTGDWVTDVMGELGFIEEVKTGNRFYIVFPERQRCATRYLGEITHVPITLENEDIHTLQALAVETNDSGWFNNLSKRLGVK